MSRIPEFACLLVLCSACDSPPGVVLARDEGGCFEFQLIAEGDHRLEAAGQLWILRDTDVRVAAQRVQVDDQVLRQRTAAMVAEAIVERYELGDVPGTVSRSSCLIGGDRAECLVGRLEDGGTSYAKRLGVVQIGDEIVILDVMVPLENSGEADRQFALLRETFRVTDG